MPGDQDHVEYWEPCPQWSAIQSAAQAYQRAGEALSAATAKAYPKGMRLAVTMGDARVIGKVVSSGGSWWHEPARVVVRNLKTGKRRHFHAFYPGHQPQPLDPLP